MSALSRIVFEPEAHRYSLDGHTVPGVTTVLKQLEDLSHIPRQNLERARQLGADVHAAIELFEEDDLDFESLEEDVAQMMEQYGLFANAHRPLFTISEGLVLHDGLGYAGMLDLYGYLVSEPNAGPATDAEPWLIDVKTGADVSRVWPLQTWAYLAAAGGGVRRRDGSIAEIDPKSRRGVLRLRRDGWQLIEHLPNHEDQIIFQSALNVHRWKAKA